MIIKLKKIASIMGIDKAILFTSSSRILSSFGSIFTIVLLVKYMSNIEQGYYYTFSSIAAIQVFFEQYSRGQSGFGLRPLTRDGAASLAHAQNLWGTAYQANKDQLVNDWSDFYD